MAEILFFEQQGWTEAIIKPLAGASSHLVELAPLYARVDGILSEVGDFLVLELELNEPGLYFTFAPEQATYFAEVIHAQLE